VINWLISVSLRNRFLVIAFFVLVAGWGYWALRTTPIDAIPDLSDNQVIVFTDWPGRSPQEVEDQITYPLTVSLQGMPDVRVVRSSSAFGFSMINVIFEDSVDLYFARSRVLERLNLLTKALPSGVVPTPLVQLIEHGQDLPFDIAPSRVIRLDHRDLDSAAKATEQLVPHIQAAEKNPELVDNPITTAIDLEALRRSTRPHDLQLAEVVRGMGTHDATPVALALEAFLGEHRRCWRLHGEGLQLDGAWLLCACGATLFVRELTHRVPR
jgi:hypothetical protein